MAYLLSEINEAVRKDPCGFLKSCEADYDNKIIAAARGIAAHRDKSHIILLAGPSGSGKTTTALRIENTLDHSGIETYTISMDNYFMTVDAETSPRTQQGDYDFESPLCLDLELLNQHFAMLDRGEQVEVPRFDFVSHSRIDNESSQTLKLGTDELAIFEGIHALNDLITDRNPQAFKLYIAARSNIVDDYGIVVFRHKWMRLCRRIIRDHNFRGSTAEETLRMWKNVRRGEKLYITPYKENANLLFDSSLACECSVLKPFIVPLLKNVSRIEFPVVDSILDAFEQIEEVDANYVPEKSLLREFIGGSVFSY